MKTIINTTDKAIIEAGMQNPFGMLILDTPEVRKEVADVHKAYIQKLHAQRRAAQ